MPNSTNPSLIRANAEGRRYHCGPDVATQEVEGKLLLVHLREGVTFRLNGTGTAIWKLAVGGLTTEAIVERLHREFGVSAPRLQWDVIELLQELVENQLLAVQPVIS